MLFTFDDIVRSATFFMAVLASGWKWIVFVSTFLFLLDAGCDLFILHVMYACQFSLELETCGICLQKFK